MLARLCSYYVNAIACSTPKAVVSPCGTSSLLSRAPSPTQQARTARCSLQRTVHWPLMEGQVLRQSVTCLSPTRYRTTSRSERGQ